MSSDVMALLTESQHSHRRLALRALFDQLRANPAVVGRIVEPEAAWQSLAEADRRDRDVVAEILLYPSVGIWLTRALHHTRSGRSAPWPELPYLNAIVAAAAIRTGTRLTIRVPVWHGVVSFPTVGHVRLPGAFPAGSAEVVCAGDRSRLNVGPTTIPFDGAASAFHAAVRHEYTTHGLTLRAWIDAHDPYHGFGDPQAPLALTDSAIAEWYKFLEEAWDSLTVHHPMYAREIAAGLRGLGPIDPESDIVGASSPAAFGAIRVSARGSSTEFAEAMVHEMQHSKLNALLGLVRLTTADTTRRHLAPWRDDPRPLIGVVHGIYAFTCGVEFWLRHGAIAGETESRQIEFDLAYRRLQVRHALRSLAACGELTEAGSALVDAVSARLAICERAPVDDTVASAVAMIVDDHRALWRLRHARPDQKTVDAVATAWLDNTPAPEVTEQSRISSEDGRRLPANRRNLLRAKVIDHATFAALTRRPASLPGTTPRADAALSTGDFEGAEELYRQRIMAEPDDIQAWAGLGLARQARGHNATALLHHPDVTVAAYRRIQALGGRVPDPAALSTWLGGTPSAATAASCRRPGLP